MAAHQKDDDLPLSWPFTLAGLLLSAAMVWFCLGFALRDSATMDAETARSQGLEEIPRHTLPGHYGLFWVLLLGAAVAAILGAAYNMSRDRRAQHA